MTPVRTAPDEDQIPAASSRVAQRTAFRLLRERKKILAGALGFHVVAASAAATTPRFVGELTKLAYEKATLTAMFTVGAWALGIAIFAAIMAYIAQRITVRAVEAAVAQLRDDVVRAVLRLPLSVVEDVGTGNLVSRTTRDIAALSRFSSTTMPLIVNVSIGLVATVVAVMITGGLVGLAFLVTLPWLWLVFRSHFRKSRRAYLRSAAAEARSDALLNETVDAAPVVDSLGVGEIRQRRYLDALRTVYVAQRFILSLRNKFFPAPTSAIYLSTALCVLWGVWLTGRGLGSLEQVTTVVVYTVALGPMLTMFGFMADEAQLTEASLARLVGVLLLDRPDNTTGTKPRGAQLAACAASFAYRSGHPVLRSVDVTIPAGQRVVVVGPSGSGKSSLARLFAGVSAPQSGSVTLGGVPVLSIPQDELHQHVMMLTQEYHVFTGSLRRNLRLAAGDATDDQLWGALRTIGADRWVAALPAGLDTFVSGGEHRLSPGQAQEVALARIVLADPPVVILDEATSLLDGAAADQVEQAVDNALAGRTVLAIAHRLSVAEHSDRVLVVKAGQIVQDGTHSELCAAGGDYARLWQHWSQDRQ